MADDVANDAWLSSILQSPGLCDPGLARELASTLAAREPSVDESGIATWALLAALEEVWERGWQPADVVHAARSGANAASGALGVALIGERARRSDAASRAPEEWVDQLRELDALGPGDPAAVRAWHRGDPASAGRGLACGLQLVGTWRAAGRIDQLVPPPSRWGAPSPARPPPTAPASDPGGRRRADSGPDGRRRAALERSRGRA